MAKRRGQKRSEAKGCLILLLGLVGFIWMLRSGNKPQHDAVPPRNFPPAAAPVVELPPTPPSMSKQDEKDGMEVRSVNKNMTGETLQERARRERQRTIELRQELRASKPRLTKEENRRNNAAALQQMDAEIGEMMRAVTAPPSSSVGSGRGAMPLGSGMCGAPTLEGHPCRNRVAGGGRCYLHRGY
jgi:hypothetical protein